ncbi:MAG: DUF3343 domain-containing protein [Bacillota bacterium]
MKYYYILFENHIDGMELEKALKNRNIDFIISPTPRELSSSCGISIRIDLELKNKVKEVINEENLNFESIEKLEVKSYFI